MIKENTSNLQEEREKEPQQIIVEIGPGEMPLTYFLETDDKEMKYTIRGETLFSLKSGDTLFEIDLPPERSVDIFRRRMNWEKNWASEGKMKSHLSDLKKVLDKNGIKGEVLHADGQKLPFRDMEVDILYMANVLSGHVKDDEMLGFEASKKRILREKTNLIKEAKRVLKTGGKLIIKEEYAPAVSVEGAYTKVLDNLENDPDFKSRKVEDFSDDNGILVLELTKLADFN